MKTLIAFIFSIAITPLLYAGNNAIDGTYVSSSEYMKLVLDNDRFQIIQIGSGHGLHATDEIIAEGYYSMVESNLLEFNSDISSSARKSNRLFIDASIRRAGIPSYSRLIKALD